MNRLAFAILAATGFSCMTALADPISPTGDATNVTAAIQAAIDAAPDGVVTLAAGTYPINKTLNISNGASLIGGGSDRGAVVLSLETTKTDLDMQSVLNISVSANTVVSNLTVTGKNAAWNNTAFGSDVAVKMDSGLLVDCSIEDNKTKNGYRQGGGIRMTGNGTVRNCTITRCQAYNTSGNAGPGEGIWMSAGLVENCRILDNRISYDCKSNPGGAVYIEGTGTLRGCLVAGNSNHGMASGVYVKGNGVVENCTIVGNSDYDVSGGTSGLAIDGANVVVRNNIVWGNRSYYGDVADVKFGNDSYINNPALAYNNTRPLIDNGMGNISVAPLFADPENGDYHVGYSYCTDAGSNQDWMANAVDLDGKARVINDTVDMGCYESDAPGGFVCAMNLSSDGASDLATVSLDCRYTGCPAGTATSASWTLTRQQDGHVVTASGFSTSAQLTAGAWDVRLKVYANAGMAESFQPAAVLVRASRAYVNENGRDEFPYDTVEKGSPSISTVLHSLGVGSTLYVAEGRYVISNGISLVDDGCTRIESLAGPDRTIVRMDNCPAFDSDSGAYGLQLDCDTAYVNGLTFVAGRNGPYFDGTEYTSRGLLKVRAAGAVVTNCVFRDLKCRNRVWGNGLDITAGTVVDCLFTRIDSFSSGGSPQQGGVILLQGGLVDRTRVEGCLSRSDSGTVPGTEMGDIIAVWGSGVLRNSLVTHCVCAMSAPVYVGKNTSGSYGGCIVNCTIVANTNTQSKVTYIKNAGTGNEQLLYYNHTGGLQMNGGAVTNCIVVDNWSACGNAVSNIYNEAGAAGIGYTLVDDRWGDASFVTAENRNIAVARGVNLFRRPERNDYSLVTGSPAIDAGLKFDWMEMARDLAGRPRLVKRVPDMGCYEAKPSHFSIHLR